MALCVDCYFIDKTLQSVPFDEFNQEQQLLSPSEARAKQASYLERVMRAVTERDEALPPRYHLFPAALLHDMQSVWRKRSKGTADARYKSLFEHAYADRHTTIPDKTFRNWTNGTISIDRKKASAFLTVFLENWHEGTGKPLCFCEESEATESCDGECENERRLCLERLLSRIFTFDDRPQDHIFVLPSPGYASLTVCKLHAERGWDLLFPVDTAHAHSWDEEHFFRSFSIVETFVKHRHPVKKPKFIYVIKPFTLMQIDANSRQRATGEAIYRTALERMARLNPEIERAEFSDTIKFIIKSNNGPEKFRSKAFALPEELLMPNRLAEAFSSQSAAKNAVHLIDLYIKKQMKIYGTKDYQYLVGRDDPGSLTYFLTLHSLTSGRREVVSGEVSTDATSQSPSVAWMIRLGRYSTPGGAHLDRRALRIGRS